MKREGHCALPQSHKEDRVTLGAWVKDERHLKRKENIDPHRETRLEKVVGFEWMTSSTWNEMYALLKQFKKRAGHCPVPQSHEEDGANLGSWVACQRKNKGELDPRREQNLEEIGVEWVLTSAPWKKCLPC
jgi:hypothetical protein